ncbi:hypothetical protein AVEN_171766-1 [Araneus ventricosus]|uniref:Uncharacterized protein n=1 Tax=Araneus ventricosus TaxID=182803 RepID=A0A4Y2GB40_ARAVE|nr:hypothetical protein AVEN_171766-1 [Araneus ventricosus]
MDGYEIKFSLVVLTSRFEASRGLYWKGPCGFEPRSDDDDILSGTPLSRLPHHTSLQSILVDSAPMGESVDMGCGQRTSGGCLATTEVSACNRPIYSGSCFEHGSHRPRTRDFTTRPTRPQL